MYDVNASVGSRITDDLCYAEPTHARRASRVAEYSVRFGRLQLGVYNCLVLPSVSVSSTPQYRLTGSCYILKVFMSNSSLLTRILSLLTGLHPSLLRKYKRALHSGARCMNDWCSHNLVVSETLTSIATLRFFLGSFSFRFLLILPLLLLI